MTGAAQEKKGEPGALLVSGVANGDYFTVVQELCSQTSVQLGTSEPGQRAYYCFTK